MLFRRAQYDDWFEQISESYTNPPVKYKGQVLPAFPPDQIQQGTTGQSGIPTLREAFVFYRDCIETYKKLGSPIKRSDHVLDFGAGWGRISRFFLRDVPLNHVHGLDVTSRFTDICKETFDSPNFHTCQPFPPTQLAEGQFNFIVGYSVFSHLSEEACAAWMKEFARLLAPGGIVAVTTRGRPFFDFCEKQKIVETAEEGQLEDSSNKSKPSNYLEALGMLFDDFAEARAQYDRGEFVHSNIEGVGGGGDLNTTFYGESFIPEAYAKKAYADFLPLEKFMYEPSYQSHPIMFFKKR